MGRRKKDRPMDDAPTELNSAAPQPGEDAKPRDAAAERAALVKLVCPNGEDEMASAVKDALAKSTSEAGPIRLIHGADNGTDTPRLVRVSMADHEGSRLAEPTPRAVIEAALSLARSKEQ